ncbi:MAG: hypothetical protein KIT62_04480 [Cyclobacteriaceae bacterium]|nr:hypothetical protein [Cyclobacteriaceae bacterium]
MKNIVVLMIIVLIGIGAGCEDQQIRKPGECIPVTYVRGICGQAVLKIQSSDYYHLGENADGDEHVFLATLECFTDAAALEDNLFYVTLNPADFNHNCAVCMAAVMYSGSKKYNVRVQEGCSVSD